MDETEVGASASKKVKGDEEGGIGDGNDNDDAGSDDDDGDCDDGSGKVDDGSGKVDEDGDGGGGNDVGGDGGNGGCSNPWMRRVRLTVARTRTTGDAHSSRDSLSIVAAEVPRSPKTHSPLPDLGKLAPSTVRIDGMSLSAATGDTLLTSGGEKKANPMQMDDFLPAETTQ
eukprot:6085276-Pleurochrysis_carterae.AAC.2